MSEPLSQLILLLQAKKTNFMKVLFISKVCQSKLGVTTGSPKVSLPTLSATILAISIQKVDDFCSHQNGKESYMPCR